MNHRPRTISEWSSYKAGEAKRLALNVFIEDAPQTALELAQSGIKTILIDMPYNRKIEQHPLVSRVKGWRQIPSAIIALTK